MNIGQLISELQDYDEDVEVVVRYKTQELYIDILSDSEDDDGEIDQVEIVVGENPGF